MANRAAIRELQTRLASRLQAARSEGVSVSWLAVKTGGGNYLFPLVQSGKYISKELAKGPNLSESNAKTAEGLKVHRTELERLRDVISSNIVTYNEFNQNIAKYHLDYANKISFTNVVSKPTLPDSKCYPIRSLVVAIITLSSLLIACIVIVFLNIKKQKVD